MKKLTIVLILMLIPFSGKAQKQTTYQTFIYTSDNLADEIAKISKGEREARGYWGDLLNAGRDAGKTIASGYVTSFIDLGVNAIGSLLTRNARLKAEWEETVKAENTCSVPIGTVSEISNFYRETSFDGAMDPKGMCFDGIGCLRKEGNDTLFYLSCHIDRSKIERIIDHSKFELILDTLIVSPLHSNLPNTPLDIPYSFKERTNFTLSLTIKVISSWMNEIVQLQKDQELGRFSITIPVDQHSLDNDGFLRYVRNEDEPSKYDVLGESFIVPRSYMGYRDENNRYRNSWGKGEYKLDIELKETCEATEQYRENWKADRKRRKKLQPKDNLLASAWQAVSNQRWDELTQSWVITTLKAPAGMVTKDIIEILGLDTEQQSGPVTPTTGSKK